MKTFSRLIPVFGVVTLALVGAPPLASAAEENAEEITQAAHEARPKTMRQVFDRALEAAELRPDQKKAVDELGTEAELRHAPVRAAKGKLMMAVADQVERGKIDRCELRDEIDEVVQAKAKAKVGDREAFEKLHSILDSGQRTKFVDGLTKAWHAFKKAHGPKAKLEKMARELNLSEDQKEKIEELAEAARDARGGDEARAARHEKWVKILDAFKGDDFDLDKVAPREDRTEAMRQRIDGHLWFSEGVLPVLTDEQRALAADKIRAKAKTLAAPEDHDSAAKASDHDHEHEHDADKEDEEEEDDD